MAIKITTYDPHVWRLLERCCVSGLQALTHQTDCTCDDCRTAHRMIDGLGLASGQPHEGDCPDPLDGSHVTCPEPT
jgi:hypothetical protein